MDYEYAKKLLGKFSIESGGEAQIFGRPPMREAVIPLLPDIRNRDKMMTTCDDILELVVASGIVLKEIEEEQLILSESNFRRTATPDTGEIQRNPPKPGVTIRVSSADWMKLERYVNGLKPEISEGQAR